MSNLRVLAGTNKIPVRSESFFRIPLRDGTIRTVIVRDALAVEDPYLKLVRAKCYSIKTGEDFSAEVTARAIKDDLIKTNIQI
jgi:hypothetical protein